MSLITEGKGRAIIFSLISMTATAPPSWVLVQAALKIGPEEHASSENIKMQVKHLPDGFWQAVGCDQLNDCGELDHGSASPQSRPLSR